MRLKGILVLVLGLVLLLVVSGYLVYRNRPSAKTSKFTQEWVENYNNEITESCPVTGVARLILEGARECVRRGAQYTPGYFKIDYPMGDLPQDQGVCTDVIIRAFRNAGIDLQELIHLDMKQHFKAYPQIWGLEKPDTNIDHRRTPNQMCFFKRCGRQLSLEVNQDTLTGWQPGDVVYWDLNNRGLLHCGIISDRRNSSEIPFVIHNLAGTREEDCLTSWRIIAHFRYPYDTN